MILPTSKPACAIGAALSLLTLQGLHAVTYTPGIDTPAGSGNYVTNLWAGVAFGSGPVASGTIWGTLRGNAADPAAPTSLTLPDGRFYADNAGLSVASGWGGTFTVQSTLTAGHVGDSASFYRYLDSDGVFAGSDAAATIGNVSNYSALTFVGSGDTTHTFDFTQMELGYLPAGTMLLVSDLEAYGSARTYEGPLKISSNLSTQFLDWTYGGNLNTESLVHQSLVTWDAGTASWTLDPGILAPNAAAINNSSDINVFITTENLTSLTVSSRVDIANASASHTFMIYAPTVPEPSSVLLGGLTGLMFFRRRRA